MKSLLSDLETRSLGVFINISSGTLDESFVKAIGYTGFRPPPSGPQHGQLANTPSTLEPQELSACSSSIIQQTAAAACVGARLSPQWLTEAKTRLKSFRSLANDWDSYGAESTKMIAVQRAESLLEWLALAEMPPPDVFPMTDGGVRLEWHVYGLDSEIDIGPDGADVTVYYRDLRTKEEWEKPLSDSGDELRAVRRRLLNRHA